MNPLFLIAGVWVCLGGPVLFRAYLESDWVLSPAMSRLLVVLCGPVLWLRLFLGGRVLRLRAMVETEEMARIFEVAHDDAEEEARGVSPSRLPR